MLYVYVRRIFSTSAGVNTLYIIETPNSVFSLNTKIEISVTKDGIYRPLWMLHILSKLLHVIKYMNNTVDLI